jgi:hypothetical protein
VKGIGAGGRERANATPAPYEGDLAKMGFMDKAYWFYKSEHPVLGAERGSGLENLLAPPTDAPVLPADFEA